MDEARQKGVITEEEYNTLKEADAVRWDAVQVDDFTQEEYLAGMGSTKETFDGAPNVRWDVSDGDPEPRNLMTDGRRKPTGMNGGAGKKSVTRKDASEETPAEDAAGTS